jgi:hypothetical protein
MVPTTGRQRRSLRYIRLAAFLAGQSPDVERLEMSLHDIEQVVGDSLPGGSRFPSWWRNDERHTHSRAWLIAGWRVAEVSLESSTVVFARGSAERAL